MHSCICRACRRTRLRPCQCPSPVRRGLQLLLLLLHLIAAPVEAPSAIQQQIPSPRRLLYYRSLPVCRGKTWDCRIDAPAELDLIRMREDVMQTSPWMLKMQNRTPPKMTATTITVNNKSLSAALLKAIGERGSARSPIETRRKALHDLSRVPRLRSAMWRMQIVTRATVVLATDHTRGSARQSRSSGTGRSPGIVRRIEPAVRTAVGRRRRYASDACPKICAL